MYILSVIPIARSLNTDQLSYFSARSCQLGQMVTVPLRNKEVQALVVGIQEVRDMKLQLRDAHYQIRNIRDIHDVQIFSPAFLIMVAALKEYTLAPLGALIDQLTPKSILGKLDSLGRREEELLGFGFELRLLQQSKEDRISYYRTLAREFLAQKKSLHIICPSIATMNDLHAGLAKGIQDQVIMISSETSKKEILSYYQKAPINPTIVISTPSYLDIPQYHKGCIVVEEESSQYYYSIQQPYIDYRVALELFARSLKIPLILAASLLRAESYARKDTGALCIEPFLKKVIPKNKLDIIPLHHKQGLSKQSDQERLAELHKMDQKKKGDFKSISPKAAAVITKALAAQEKIFCYVQKKSLAPHIVCRDCGKLATSPKSKRPYSLYLQGAKKEPVYVCQQTGERIPAFDTCQFCQSWKLMQLGIGAQGVEKELKEAFPKAQIFRLDGDAKKKDEREILEAYAQDTAMIVVGTERALNLLPYYNQAILVSIESFFAQLSYTNNERALSLIIQSIEKNTGTSYLQTRNISEAELPILQDGMYPPYIAEEIKERKNFHFPPFTTIITLKHITTTTQLNAYYQALLKQYKDWNTQIFTQPGPSGKIFLFLVISLPYEDWSISRQDPQLKAALYARDPKIVLRVNPARLDD